MYGTIGPTKKQFFYKGFIMNFVSLFRNVVMTVVLITGINAQDFGMVPASANELDREALSLIKDELKSSLKTLIAIRNSQDPALQSSMSNTLKETLYIIGALILGGGSILLAIIRAAGLENVCQVLSDPRGQSAALVGFPFFVIAVIIAYTFLKLIFSRLLAQKESATTTNIKESLMLIEQTINKLNYEIKKVERLSPIV